MGQKFLFFSEQFWKPFQLNSKENMPVCDKLNWKWSGFIQNFC